MTTRILTLSLVPALAFAALAIQIPGCASASRAEVVTPGDEEAIRQGLVDFVAFARAGDWDELAGLYEDDAVMLPPGAEIVIGRAPISAFFMPFTVDEFELETVVVEGRGDLAYARGTYDWVVRVADSAPMPDRGKWLTVWRKQADGSWLMIEDIWNSDLSQ